MATIRNFEIGEEYHIYARGVDLRDTFISETDYYKFMSLIYLCNDTKNVNSKEKFSLYNYDALLNTKTNKIVSVEDFCLMPNHFHIRIKEISENGISKFMQKLLSGYTIYFNKKYNRTGSLFSTTYKTKHINSDLYSEYLKDYFYYNPLKLIREDYKSVSFLLGERNLDQEETDFIETYPFRMIP